MKMKTVLILNKEKSRQNIIEDIQSEVKERFNYKKDNLYRRCRGVRDLEENQFFFMIKKIVLDELPMIKEVMVCNKEKFKKYIKQF